MASRVIRKKRLPRIRCDDISASGHLCGRRVFRYYGPPSDFENPLGTYFARCRMHDIPAGMANRVISISGYVIGKIMQS